LEMPGRTHCIQGKKKKRTDAKKRTPEKGGGEKAGALPKEGGGMAIINSLERKSGEERPKRPAEKKKEVAPSRP